MATKDFKVRHSLTVSENATIEGNLTLGGNTVSRVLDSDEVVAIINQTSSGFDSDQIVTIIGENPGSQTISTSTFTFTSPANDSDFSGTDDNGRTLGYTAGKIHVYLNGILLTETVDYIASNGSTVSLINAPDSDDVLTIVKFLGTVQAGFDSDQVVSIINENVVSGSVDSDVAAVAALRRDADSDSLVIQKLRQDLDSESSQIRILRADVDSDAATIGTFLNDSDNSATLFATLSGPVTFLAKNDAGETLFPGTAVYIKGVSGNKATVDKANASSSSTMPAFGIISEVSNSGAEAIVTTFGTLEGLNTTAFTLGTNVYISADSDGGLTSTKPTDINHKIQNIGIVTRVHQDSGSIKIGGAGRSNDVDNHTRLSIDSDNIKLQSHSIRLDTLETRADSDSIAIQSVQTNLDSQKIEDHSDISLSTNNTDSTGALSNTLTGDGFSSMLSGDALTYFNDEAYTWPLSGENTTTIDATLTEITSALSHRLDSDVITFNKADSEAFYVKNDSGGYLWIHPSTSTGAYADGKKLRIRNNGSSLVLALVDGDPSQPTNFTRETSGSWPPSFGTNFESVTEAGIFNVGTKVPTTTVTTSPSSGDFLFYNGTNWVSSQLFTRLNADSDALVTLTTKFNTDSDKLDNIESNVDSDLYGQRLSDHSDVNTNYNYYNTGLSIATDFYASLTSVGATAFSGTTNVSIHTPDQYTDMTAKYEDLVAKFFVHAEKLGRLDSDIITFENNEGIYFKFSSGQKQVVYPVTSDSEYDTDATFRFKTNNGGLFISSGNGATATHYVKRLDSDVAANFAGDISEVGWADVTTYTRKQLRPTIGHFLKWDGTEWISSAVAGSIDSDVAAVAALRRDADSDSIRIQEIATEIEGINQLVDSDLKAIADLRNDVDSDSLVIQTIRGDVDTLQNATRLDSESVARVTDTQFTIVNNGASAYSFTGDGFASSSDNPTIYVQRGHTYHFNVNASGHPFEIRLSNGGSAYSDGVTNNAAEIGRVVFTVPMNAPDKLVYQCTNHASMVGDILVSKKGFDSDQIASMILENAGSGGFDSDQILAIIEENPGSQAINTTVYTFTSPANDSEFSGLDDNSQSLSYTPGKIYVYLNGILLTDTVDYTATTGTSVSLVNAPDSDDVLTIVKHVGTVQVGFDSDQIIDIINETAQGLTDSDLKTLADLRNDLDSESAVIRQLRREQDSDSANSGSSGGGDVGFDSDQVVAIISENAASNSIVITRFDFTATQGQTVFTGSDNNGNTLNYSTGKVQVFLNGILLLQTEDYLDSDGSNITLTSGADSDDNLSIIKYLGTVQTGFDSDQIVAIINENVVSGSVDSDVAAIAQLRRDADSDSLIIQQLREDLGSNNIDSDYIIARQIVDAKHYNYSGTLTTNTGSKRLYMHRDGVLGAFDMHVATAPVGAAINITVNKNGSSIGTGTITSGNTDNNLQTLSTTSFASGDYLTVDITQIGSSTAGEDLYVVFRIVG